MDKATLVVTLGPRAHIGQAEIDAGTKLLELLREASFPVTAALVGIYVFDSSLRWTQWVGVVITVGVISLLPVRRRDLVVPRTEPGLATT